MKILNLCYTLLYLLFANMLGSQLMTAQTRYEKKAINTNEGIKKDNIKYTWHSGTALLKTGLKLKGSFKYQETKTGVPKIIVKDVQLKEEKIVDLPMFERLDLQGAERVLNAKDGQTHFVWIEEYNDILRVVRNGGIKVYDNSRIVSEKYKYLTGYTLLAHKNEKEKLSALKQVKDLEDLMRDRPYFMQSAHANGKIKSKDLRVVMYLVDLYNDPNPMETLQWENAQIRLKNGQLLEGKAVIQPLDLRNEFNTDNYAYVHFHDGKDFRLLRNDEISQLTVGTHSYLQGFYSLTDKQFFGIPWSYNGKNYLIATQIVNAKSDFFSNYNSGGEDWVMMEDVAGSYRRAANEAELRILYSKAGGQ